MPTFTKSVKVGHPPAHEDEKNTGRELNGENSNGANHGRSHFLGLSHNDDDNVQ